MLRSSALTLILTAGAATAAPLTVVFQDSAPTDRLLIFNEGCPLADLTLQLDLTTAAAGGLLDTVAGGPGVGAVHIPEVVDGNAVLAPVTDGDQSLTLFLPQLATFGAVTITLDVDDTDSADEIIVTGSELAGATVTLLADTTDITAQIGADGRATFDSGSLLSLCATS